MFEQLELNKSQMKKLLLIFLVLFLFFSCKKEETPVEDYIYYEWQGKSNSGQASTTGLEVTYTYSNDYKLQRIVTPNNGKHTSTLYNNGPIRVEKGFVATLKVKNNCKPLACYIKPVLRIYTGGVISNNAGSNSYYWYLAKEDSSISVVDSLTISYIVK
jgi:hypothetical protein